MTPNDRKAIDEVRATQARIADKSESNRTLKSECLSLELQAAIAKGIAAGVNQEVSK